MVPPAGKKHSFFVRNCYVSYCKVWFATNLVRHSLNALLPKAWWRGVGSTTSRLQNLSSKQGRVQAGSALIPDCWCSFLQQVLMVTPGLLLRLHGHAQVPQGHQAKAGALETPPVAWPQSSPEETLQFFKYQKVINSPWEEVGSPQFHLQAAYIDPTSLSSLWLN